MKLKMNAYTGSFSLLGGPSIASAPTKSGISYKENNFNEYSPFAPSKSKDEKVKKKK